jgi:hypothetical protein
MKNIWKFLFWICLIITIVSNVFWIYNTLENAVGNNYYKVSCEEYYKDVSILKVIIEKKETKKELISFLENNNVKFESFSKGAENIIVLNSFSIAFDKNGNKTNE